MMLTHRAKAVQVTLDLFRTAHFLFLGAALLFIVFDKQIGLQDSNPGLQAMLFGLAQITVRATVGYWIARSVLGKLKRGDEWNHTDGMQYLARAILVGAVIMTSR